MADSLCSIEERDRIEREVDLRSFAEEHDLAIGEARQIIREAGTDKRRADKLAHRTKKW